MWRKNDQLLSNSITVRFKFSEKVYKSIFLKTWKFCDNIFTLTYHTFSTGRWGLVEPPRKYYVNDFCARIILFF